MFRSKILRKFLVLIGGVLLIYTAVTLFVAVPKIDNTIRNLEEKNAKLVLDKVVMLTENVAKDLEHFREKALAWHKSELVNMTSVVTSILESVYRDVHMDMNASQRCRSTFLNLIGKIRYDHNNYFFAFDYNCTMLAHPYIEKGSDMRDVVDIKGEPIVPRLLKVAREKGEGFTHYWWQRPGKNKNPVEKLSYSKDFPQWQFVIATGVYLDDIEKEVANRRKELFHTLREIMNQTRIGKTGYIYIFDSQRMIIHPNSNIDGKNFKKLLNPGKGTYIYDDLVKAAHGSGVLRYKWDKPSDKGHYIYDKVSWIRYIPSMDLYVVSSAYTDEFESVSRSIHNQLLYLGVGVLLITLLLSVMLLRYLLKPVERLAQTASVIAEGNYHIRASVDTADEIGELARNFNTMVDRLEEQIRTLDFKVKEKTAALEEMAITDPLTKLFNRRYFSEVSPQMFNLAKRNGEALSVMMLDIDRFKKINDTFGHQTGDRVIEGLASIITSLKRESDIACRYGGEEFILLLPETSIEGAKELAHRIRQTVENYSIDIDEKQKVQVTVSIGVAVSDFSKDDDIESVIRRADDAMYKAKKMGRNRTCYL